MARPPGDEGFSLLEVLIAAGVVAGALCTAAALFAAVVQSGVDARARTASALLAQQKIEELIAALAAGAAESSGTDRVTISGRIDPGSGEPLYDRWWRVLPLATEPGGAFTMEVEVGSTARTAALTARIATVRRRVAP